MPRTDWLVGRDRSAAATDRIYEAASDIVVRKGFEALTIGALAQRVHCSPATIYRHVGGKAEIMEAVTLRLSMQVVDAVRAAIVDLEGAERVATAVVVALELIRAQPLGHVIMNNVVPGLGGDWLTDSRLIASIAEEIIGRRDEAAAQWLIRATLALWLWPGQDRDSEVDMVRRFIGPALGSP